MKTGVRNAATVFLMTDAHVADEKFLVLINDLLASGEIPDIFSEDEIEEIVNSIRPEVKQVAILDTKENCWKFFIDKVRKQLKVVLCFSPVGKLLRVRARRFPAVVNCTCIDWFHEWPHEALVSVSSKFLQEVDLLTPELRDSVSSFVAYIHTSVNNMSQVYLENEKRYNYTTPKSFLELIKLYRSLLERKHAELLGKMERLENGLLKLQSTASQVDALKEKLAVQEIQLAQKNDDADKLILKVGAESDKVAKEKAIADEEGRKVAAINDEVSAKQASCETDLKRAEPALAAAEAALNILDKTNLTELKSFGSPPAAVTNVTAAVMVLLLGGQSGKVPKDRSWKAAKSMMAKVDEFLNNLKNYDKDHIHENAIKAMQDYINNEEFNPDIIGKKSFAAAGLCSWAINIVKYYEVFCDVLPKRLALEEANRELNAAKEKLSGIQAKIAGLEAQLNGLLGELQAATDEKTACQEEKDRTNLTIELANRLVGGLSSEKHRWTDSIALYRELEKQLPGDVLLISAFVSYAGAFDKKYRVDLEQNIWIPYVSQLEVPIPITEGLDPLTMLTDNAQIAQWQNEGLPSDRMSTENATILTNCERWPLMIDPQLQGIKWIKRKYGEHVQIIRLDQKGYMDRLERSLTAGETVLIENLEEEFDPVLEPVLGRNTIKKGRAIKLGDKEIEYNSNFKLILHTKLANPHYKPEMQAQTTLINFTVTKAGLEDQLLAAVVSKERPDLEQTRSDLTKQNNEYTITLKQLEDNLLARLSAAGGNFLGDTALVENLEHTKKTAAEIEEKVAEAKVTEVMINTAREDYRHAAARASLLYFILNDLYKINPIYQFSLKAFSVVFDMAIERAAVATSTNPDESIRERVRNLIDQITYQVILYTTRGLFEKDKFIFKVQVAFQVLLHSGEIQKDELDFLLKFPTSLDFKSPVDFLSDSSWGAIKCLAEMDEFKNLDRDIEGSGKRWKKFVESEYIELEKFPQEWKSKTALQRLCMLRALRPDRMIYAIEIFIEEKLGAKYKENRRIPFAESFTETGPNIPVFFILSPGVDPLLEVESLGKKLGFTQENGKFHNISLGQGQDVVASAALDIAAKEGHWVVLQNIHLVANWLPTLEKKLGEISETGLAHEAYRVFMSAEPASSPAAHIIPQGVLENSIKITNEPPTKISANLHKALDNFSQDTLEMCSKEAEFKSILFSLCYFHAVVAERRKFGPQGWNRVYPFNTGDLTISAMVLYNYLEANNKVPWEDLRYLFGEIMYGGHITDDWDRRLCRTYLEEYMGPEQLDGDLNLAPQFPVPGNMDYKGYHTYIDESLPQESPALYGLHLNAEIGFLTTLSDSLFRVVHDLQPRDSAGSSQSGSTREEVVESAVEDLTDKLPDPFNMIELHQKEETKTPYTVVCLQECERMNSLTQEIRRSLTELQLGLKGELTITSAMDDLSTALFLDKVPQTWLRYPTTYPLATWFSDLMQRVKELETWTTDFGLPNSVWIGGLFNPQAFLTAIMQQTARKNEWPLDKMVLNCDVTKKNRDDFGAPPREGSYINGLYMEGARWDIQTGAMAEARLKELTPQMPVVYLKAILMDKLETKGTYCCPVYKTKVRGPTYVWKFHLKTKEKSAKWILGGVAILLST
ncbi:dynein beta chain, ciliary-like [Convolutriloba macropyga]|uniref:dynein beta chain, ciliary-like n=1 Tax=Convolutriloba macropyga TaxID=536237 RepID=UPI003F522390